MTHHPFERGPDNCAVCGHDRLYYLHFSREEPKATNQRSENIQLTPSIWKEKVAP